MFTKTLAAVIAAGFVVAAGAVYAADSSFPASPNESSASLGTERITGGAGEMKTGAAQSVFPSDAREHGTDREIALGLRMSPSIAGGKTTPFPSSVSEAL